MFFLVCTNFIAVPAGKINMWSRKILKGPFQNANSLPVQAFFTGKLLVFVELNHTEIENHTQRYRCVSSSLFYRETKIKLVNYFRGTIFLRRWLWLQGNPPKNARKVQVGKEFIIIVLWPRFNRHHQDDDITFGPVRFGNPKQNGLTFQLLLAFTFSSSLSRWWQLKCFLCSSLPGEDESNLTSIFSNGLVQPPTSYHLQGTPCLFDFCGVRT